MPSFFYDAAAKALQREFSAWERGDQFVRYSVKRRTWRTLWLVPRTYRVKVPAMHVRLWSGSYEEEA